MTAKSYPFVDIYKLQRVEVQLCPVCKDFSHQPRAGAEHLRELGFTAILPMSNALKLHLALLQSIHFYGGCFHISIKI